MPIMTQTQLFFGVEIRNKEGTQPATDKNRHRT
jgi:hypothetical protein